MKTKEHLGFAALCLRIPWALQKHPFWMIFALSVQNWIPVRYQTAIKLVNCYTSGWRSWICALLWKSVQTGVGCLQVGLPVAAGFCLPNFGVMLTPSLAGALMGLSSLGVMANSLVLRWTYSFDNHGISFVRGKNKEQKKDPALLQDSHLLSLQEHANQQQKAHAS